MDALREILTGLGVERGLLTPDCRLRADLGLDSTETTELELELRRRCATEVDLWDAEDYSLGELAALIRRTEAG